MPVTGNCYVPRLTSHQLVAHSVAKYAVSFKGFPERTDAVVTSAYSKEVKYHGSKLFL